MKKLLSIFGTMALTTTVSTSVISCKKEAPQDQPGAPVPQTEPNKPPQEPTEQPEAPEQLIQTDLSSLADNIIINLGQLSTRTTAEFLTKLHEKLKEIPILNTIKTSDYVVYKKGFDTPIENNDIPFIIDQNFFIVVNSINIKISAEKGTNFKGEKNITVNYYS